MRVFECSFDFCWVYTAVSFNIYDEFIVDSTFFPSILSFSLPILIFYFFVLSILFLPFFILFSYLSFLPIGFIIPIFYPLCIYFYFSLVFLKVYYFLKIIFCYFKQLFEGLQLIDWDYFDTPLFDINYYLLELS